MSALTINEWAAICERVSEFDEPPIRTCPHCHALGYEVERGVIACSRGCLLRWAGENGPWVVCRDGKAA